MKRGGNTEGTKKGREWGKREKGRGKEVGKGEEPEFQSP